LFFVAIRTDRFRGHRFHRRLRKGLQAAQSRSHREKENLFPGVRQPGGGRFAPRSDHSQRLLHAVDDSVPEALPPRSCFPLVHAFTAFVAAGFHSISPFCGRCDRRLFECRQLDGRAGRSRYWLHSHRGGSPDSVDLRQQQLPLGHVPRHSIHPEGGRANSLLRRTRWEERSV